MEEINNLYSEQFNSPRIHDIDMSLSIKTISNNLKLSNEHCLHNEKTFVSTFYSLQDDDLFKDDCEQDAKLCNKIDNGISSILTEIIDNVIEDVNQCEEIYSHNMESVQSDSVVNVNICEDQTCESYRVATYVVNDILNNFFNYMKKQEIKKFAIKTGRKIDREEDVVSLSVSDAVHSLSEDCPSIELVDFNLAQSASMVHCLQCPVETCRYVTINMNSFEKHVTINHNIEKQCLEFFVCTICNALSNVHSVLKEHCEIYHAVSTTVRQEKTKRKRGRPRKIPDLAKKVGPDVALKEYIACLDEEDRVMSLCPECGRCFEKQESLHKHMRVHHREDYDWQPDDSSVSTRPMRLRRHSSNNTPIGCDMTNDKIVNLRGLRQRESIRLSDNDEDSTAGECSLSTSNLKPPKESNKSVYASSDVDCIMNVDPKTLIRSSRRKRGRPRKPSSAPLSSVSVLEHCCKQCDATFSAWSLLWQHVREVHWQGKRIFICPESNCGKPFRSGYQLQRHRRIHAQKRGRAAVERLSCDQCDKTYTSDYKLTEHVKRCHLNCGATHACVKCAKSFFSRGALQRHEHLAHMALRVFRCKQCSDVVFSKKRLLVEHVAAQHKGAELIKKCVLCSASFGAQKDLERHLEVEHEGSRPFLCEHCGKTFVTAAHLQRHSVAHTTERNFQCQHCSKAFLRVDKLRRHELSVHSAERPHLCHLCGKGFARKDKLTEHIKQHNREANLPCDVCGDLFVMKSALNKHKRQVHDIKANRSPRVKVPQKLHMCKPAKKSDCLVELDAVMLAAASAGIGENNPAPPKRRRQSRKAKPKLLPNFCDSASSNTAPSMIPTHATDFLSASQDLNAASHHIPLDFPLNLIAPNGLGTGSEHRLLHPLHSGSLPVSTNSAHLFNASLSASDYHQFISAPNFAVASSVASFRSVSGLPAPSESLCYSFGSTTASVPHFLVNPPSSLSSHALVNSFRPTQL